MQGGTDLGEAVRKDETAGQSEWAREGGDFLLSLHLKFLLPRKERRGGVCRRERNDKETDARVCTPVLFGSILSPFSVWRER